MIELRDRRVLVVGLARTGRAVAERLRREGAIVTITDVRPPSAFGSTLQALVAQKMGLELGIHRPETFLNQNLIVVSPGVPWDMPQLDAARRHKVPVVPEVEAASWFFQGTLVGITGTNGKTTTATLLGKMLEASGFASYVAGNIGVPLISVVDFYSPESVVVAELSSFQLEAIQTFRPYVAVLLNLSPNHLDRHGTFDAYVSAKAQIFRNQQPGDYAVLNADDPVVMGLAPAIASDKVLFSTEQELPEGVMLSSGRAIYRVAHLERVLFEEREIKLRGAFNAANTLAASAAACILGADFKAIRSAVREFAGVEHRLEYVGEVRGVAFYNDSKATSVDATAKALSTFERGVHLILGGKDKGAPYAPLKPLLEGRVKAVYLIGEAAEKIATELGGVSLYQAGTIDAAVEAAFRRAVPGDAVLLSPACSSYDQFRDFEERGKVFKEIVHDLARHSHPAAEPAVPSEPTHDIQPEPESAAESVEVQAAPGRASDREQEAEAPHSAIDAAAEVDDARAAREAHVEPRYIYETGSEDSPPADDEAAQPDLITHEEVDEPAITSADDAIEEEEPVLPYETGRVAPEAQRSEGDGRNADVVSDPQSESVKSRHAIAQTQQRLFGGKGNDSEK